MMKKTLLAAMMVAMAFGFVISGCDDAEDLFDDLTEADPENSCGRYCIKCDECKDTGDGYVKDLMDYTCAFDESGRACQEVCDRGSGLIPGVDIKANVEATEASLNKKITDASVTCELFALSAATGATDGPCLRFCAKCVECSSAAGSADAMEWCGKEGGMPCVAACIKTPSFEDYIEDFENLAAENTEGIESLDDIQCDDFESTLESAGGFEF